MSTKHIRTAADLVRFGASLKVECGNCGAAKTMSGQMVAQVGGAKELTAIRNRFRCSRCEQRAARFVILPPL